MASPRKPSKSSTPVDINAVADQRGRGDELHQHAGGTHPPLTTNQGIPIADNQNSLRATPRGPTLLEDFILREKITHFDHERIPERIVHARGSAAHGYFELTASLHKYTTAKILTEVGVKTPVFTRFSTVAGGAGSVDTPRDVRGFAVKFYTKEGNWDLVGNNIPVFFIQDAIKFPDLIHAVKMEPDRGFPQAASAHDTFWDFISLTPESLHMIMWAMSDRTIPRSLRMIEGFGIHSFRLLDGNGNSTFVKFHWRPKLGLQSTVWDEAVKLAGADPDFHRRDLFEAIQQGDFPEWELGVQLFTEEEADKFPFDHLDSTKLIPEELVPLKIVGRMVLDRWPDNFFAETEQVAYCPANIAPGIDFSNDPLLQGRLFSYLDTQLSRLGGPNFHQIPINAPKCPFANLQRDGHMQMGVPKGRVAYEPSSLQDDTPRESVRGFPSHATPSEDGGKGRVRAASFADHYSQARLFFRSQSKPEQAHLASALVFELSKVEAVHVRAAVVGHLRHIDPALAQRVADGLGMDALPPAPPAAVAPQDMPPSPALQLIGKMKHTLQGRAIGILVHDGSDAATVKALQKAARDAGATVKIVAPKVGGAKLSDGKKLAADGQLAGTPSFVFDAVAVVLSAEAGKQLSKESAAVDFVSNAFAHLKAIAADAGAQPLLKAGNVVKDAGVLDAGNAKGFIEAAKTRQWDREPKLRMLA
ncbi:catalase [Xanthomonas translucens]|uniref:catalase n=1 Tax=Xanthomonas campestris pv. translucens TaxID=343 RepID=UPI0006424EDF|nr:catalase [Xanthomonas translucens]AKK66852.1 catalase [Xanthomonas translucens pv. undulosa]AVY67734.1 catalase [Xanthomonas translucens pv. undulosa]MCT8271687.1 catalase [Xanthomonas translucens pv. undulosa]WLA01908.1 catalase [Xanthomonas translucens]WLA11488.1 catalase [Xanthomonas translucens]